VLNLLFFYLILREAMGSENKIACAGFTLYLNCPNRSIHIIYANWGRTDEDTCPNDFTFDFNCLQNITSEVTDR